MIAGCVWHARARVASTLHTVQLLRGEDDAQSSGDRLDSSFVQPQTFLQIQERNKHRRQPCKTSLPFVCHWCQPKWSSATPSPKCAGKASHHNQTANLEWARKKGIWGYCLLVK